MATKKDQSPKSNDQSSGKDTEVEVVEPKHFATRFKPGNKLGGRPKGTRNQLSEAVMKDILADWEVAGPSAIQACRLENPGVYLRVVASLIPKEFKFNPGSNELDTILEQLDPEQLAQFHGLLTAYGNATQSQPGQAKEITGK
jgi:hypothetical protein